MVEANPNAGLSLVDFVSQFSMLLPGIQLPPDLLPHRVFSSLDINNDQALEASEMKNIRSDINALMKSHAQSTEEALLQPIDPVQNDERRTEVDQDQSLQGISAAATVFREEGHHLAATNTCDMGSLFRRRKILVVTRGQGQGAHQGRVFSTCCSTHAK